MFVKKYHFNIFRIRKLALLAVLLFLFSAAAHPEESEDVKYYYVNSENGAHLRESPSLKSEIECSAEYGEKIEVAGASENEKWAKAVYKGCTGWVSFSEITEKESQKQIEAFNKFCTNPLSGFDLPDTGENIMKCFSDRFGSADYIKRKTTAAVNASGGKAEIIYAGFKGFDIEIIRSQDGESSHSMLACIKVMKTDLLDLNVSTKKDIIAKFGFPDEYEKNKLIYVTDIGAENKIVFLFKNDALWGFEEYFYAD
ncbi:MAG: SH3 domain-containing protein [Spirochaetes bacterium]|nr:SH3 domain-containing protein [Spirochaetota bacterium]